MITGIICEYNPFHSGHKKQLDTVRAADPKGTIVCLMSGNYVQRGAPAIIDKMYRAEAAIQLGADLVLELPVTVSLSSAEGFAAGGVSILSGFCDTLCFGAETSDAKYLMDIAKLLLSDRFKESLREKLQSGVSFPAARQAALTHIGIESDFITKPNNILAIEYCKAIISQSSKLLPYAIPRSGDYHAITEDHENPSATFVRNQMLNGSSWSAYMPTNAATIFENAQLHHISHGARAILYRLQTMADEDFQALPYGSEGLWRKLMHAARRCSSLEDILTETKSKRYTRSRLDRMIMCAFLGITERMLNMPAPYVRILALNQRGREILKNARKSGAYINIGEQQASSEYQLLEERCGRLYGLFSAGLPEPPDSERKKRIIIA